MFLKDLYTPGLLGIELSLSSIRLSQVKKDVLIFGRGFGAKCSPSWQFIGEAPLMTSTRVHHTHGDWGVLTFNYEKRI